MMSNESLTSVHIIRFLGSRRVEATTDWIRVFDGLHCYIEIHKADRGAYQFVRTVPRWLIDESTCIGLWLAGNYLRLLNARFVE